MSSVTRAAFIVFGFYLVAAAPAAAQGTPRPGVDCALLTVTQARGQVCATAPKPDVSLVDAGGAIGSGTIAFVPSDATCKDLNVYDQAELPKVFACIAWSDARQPAPARPTFDVGAVYVHPYPQIRMVVLAVGRSLEGVPVVTAQFVAGPDTGSVFAFRVDQAVPWTRAGGQ